VQQAAPAAGPVTQSEPKGQGTRAPREPRAERSAGDFRDGVPRPPVAIGGTAPPPRERLLDGF